MCQPTQASPRYFKFRAESRITFSHFSNSAELRPPPLLLPATGRPDPTPSLLPLPFSFSSLFHHLVISFSGSLRPPRSVYLQPHLPDRPPLSFFPFSFAFCCHPASSLLSSTHFPSPESRPVSFHVRLLATPLSTPASPPNQTSFPDFELPLGSGAEKKEKGGGKRERKGGQGGKEGAGLGDRDGWGNLGPGILKVGENSAKWMR